MIDVTVKIPFSRLDQAATHLGSQAVCACPPTKPQCWNQREMTAILPRDNKTDDECRQCWLAYFINYTERYEQ